MNRPPKGPESKKTNGAVAAKGKVTATRPSKLPPSRSTPRSTSKENTAPGMQVPNSTNRSRRSSQGEGTSTGRPAGASEQRKAMNSSRPKFAAPTENIAVQRPLRKFHQTNASGSSSSRAQASTSSQPSAPQARSERSNPSPSPPRPRSPLPPSEVGARGEGDRQGLGGSGESAREDIEEEPRPAGRIPQHQGEVTLQRPYRSFAASRDFEAARRLQREEEEGATGGVATDTSVADDPTAMDEMLARQLQAQEEMGIGTRSYSTLGDILSRTLSSPESSSPEDDSRGSPETPAPPRHRFNIQVINRRQTPPPHAILLPFLGRHGRVMMGSPRAPQLRRRGMEVPAERGAEGGERASEDLPEGELDPEAALFARSSPHREELNFLSIMRDPNLMLLMLMMRAPQLMVPDDINLNDYEELWNLAERIGEVRNRGMSDAEIRRVPEKVFHAYEKYDDPEGLKDCRVCLTDFEAGNQLRCLPCSHRFHKTCIDEWLRLNSTCPICRRDLRES